MPPRSSPHASDFTGAARHLLVLGIAEVPPPEESLVWMLVDHVGGAIADRADSGTQGIVMPDLIKVRTLTSRVPSLLRASRRAVVVTGTRLHSGQAKMICRRLRLSDQLARSTPPAPLRPTATGADLGSAPTAATDLSACLASGTPLGGLDHLIVPLPERGSSAWMIPHLGTWLARMSASLLDAVWAIMLEEAIHRRRDDAA